MDEQRTRNEKPRAYARRIAEQGVGLLAHALNACAMPERTYRYDDTTQDRFRALMFEVVQIVDTDKIIERRSAAAQADIGLQRIPCIRISQKTRVASSARSSISNRRRRCAFVEARAKASRTRWRAQ